MHRSFEILFAGVLAAASIPAASAQEIRIARQFSMGYLQFNVMEHDKLLEKHAAALGLKDVKIAWSTFNGPNAMNDALISDSVDIVAGGVISATPTPAAAERRRRSAHRAAAGSCRRAAPPTCAESLARSPTPASASCRAADP